MHTLIFCIVDGQIESQVAEFWFNLEEIFVIKCL